MSMKKKVNNQIKEADTGFLCLTRHEDHSKDQDTIIIDVPPSDKPQQIKVMLVQIKGSQARIGIACAKDTCITRREVWSEEGTKNKLAQLKRRAEAEHVAHDPQ